MLMDVLFLLGAVTSRKFCFKVGHTIVPVPRVYPFMKLDGTELFSLNELKAKTFIKLMYTLAVIFINYFQEFKKLFNTKLFLIEILNT